MQIPERIRLINRQTEELARRLGVPYTKLVRTDGLYVALRSRRDPINTNKKKWLLKVQMRRGGQIVFEELVPFKGFPSELLITKLALVA